MGITLKTRINTGVNSSLYKHSPIKTDIVTGSCHHHNRLIHIRENWRI